MDDIRDALHSAYQSLLGQDARTLYAKVHALDIHEYTNTPEEQRPRISRSVPERSHRFAYDLINVALKYLTEAEGYSPDDEELQVEARNLLLQAAQHLEKLYLNRPPSVEGRTEELYNAALAYYLAGHAPRAFVIMKGVTTDAGFEDDTKLLRWMFLRNMPQIHRNVSTRLSQKIYEDWALAETVIAGRMIETAAVEQALRHTLNRIYLLLFEFARSGVQSRIETASDLAYLAYQVALDHQLYTWWWHYQCTRALLKEYRQCSLWSCLRPLLRRDTSNLTRRYIQAAFYRSPQPVLELWSSQQHALNFIDDGRSYCLKMPTSSGKTRIAELAILQFLIDNNGDPSKKCLYVAPYRALAVEVEDAFRRSFTVIGVPVSQLYGSYDLNPAEFSLANDAKILIGTPEKLDAFLRYAPTDSNQIGLIIVDEGHIIDGGDRGLRYELFIHRLVRKYERSGIQMLFISAVMPNVDQFSRWITGREAETGVIQSIWRASQQMLGIVSWNGRSGRVDYLYRDLELLDQDFFISNYFVPLDPSELRAARCGIRLFPGKNASKAELLALASLRAVSEGATLIFAPKIPLVESTAEAIIYVIGLRKKINDHFGRKQSVLPIADDTASKEKLSRCIRFAADTTGPESLIVRALKLGFVVHHADVPRTLRVSLEELVRDGVLNLVVSTNTLAQGVNLPVKTILIHSLARGRGNNVPARDFWNICGRAGRATKETEGSVFLLVDATATSEEGHRTPLEKAKSDLASYVQQATAEQVTSGIRNLLQDIVYEWRLNLSALSHFDISDLCDRLGSGDDTWLSLDLRHKLAVLDTQLLAMLQELKLEECTVEQIADLFRDSLLYIQLTQDDPLGGLLTYDDGISLIVQRVHRILTVCNSPAKRQLYYRMGISIDDCVFIGEHQQELIVYLGVAQSYMTWTPEQRADYIIGLCDNYIMELEDVRPLENEGERERIPACWSSILRLWLLGLNAEQIKIRLSADLPTAWRDTMKLSTLIDDLCEFRLPWGLNAISTYLRETEVVSTDMTNEMQIQIEFVSPPVIDYFASNLRFGVHDPVAAILLAAGLSNRQAALALAQIYEGDLEPINVFRWIESLPTEAVYQCTGQIELQDSLLSFLELRRHANEEKATPEVVNVIELILQDGAESYPPPGGILVTQIDGSRVRLFDPEDLKYLGTVEITEQSVIAALQSRSRHLVLNSVSDIEDTKRILLEIAVSSY